MREKHFSTRLTRHRHRHRHQINYESNLWLHNRNLMKTLSPDARQHFYSHQTKRMLLRSNQKLCDSYPNHVAYISFIFLSISAPRNPSYLLPFGSACIQMPRQKPKRQLLTTRWRRRRRGRWKVFRMSPVAEKIIMLSCRWWKIVWPIFRGTAREMRNFSVTLDVIYWFIIITENEARSFLFTMSPVFLSPPRRSPASCLACKFIVLLFSFFRFCLVRRTVEEGFGEFNYECRGLSGLFSRRGPSWDKT